MKTTLLVVSIISAFSAPLFGRINETLEKCIERYGEAKKKEDGRYQFERSGFMLLVDFCEGKVDRIIYYKRRASGFGWEKISQEGVDQLLKINAPEGVNWRFSGNLFGGNWESEDGSLKADYNTISDTLTIFTKEYEIRRKKEEEQDEKKRLEGL